MIIDLSLTNNFLYNCLKIERLAGKLTVTTPPEEAISVITANMENNIEIDQDEVILTGGMAIWAYLVVFHYLHGKTNRIYYQDGRGNKVLVAAHG